MKLTLSKLTPIRLGLLVAMMAIFLVSLLACDKLHADDEQAQIELDFGTVILQAAGELQLADGEAEVPAPEPRGVEIGPIGGPFGGIELPENFKRMMKAAQEMQAVKAKYDATISQLIDEAKKLEDPSGNMAAAAKAAALAREAEQLKTEMEAKQQEMRKQMGGGIGVFGGGGAIEIGGFGGDEGIDILPMFPKGGLRLPLP